MFLALLPALAASDQPGERRIMPGDLVRVICSQIPWLCLTRTVDENGRIQLPELGGIPVATQTPATIAKRIAALLTSGSNVTPTVEVEAVTSRDGMIRISGAVERPLELRFRNGTHLADLLKLAGPSETADLDRLSLSRVDGSFETIDSERRIRLIGGDRVFVPVLSGATDISVLGGVVNPSAVRFHKGMTLAAAVEAAGGLAGRGDGHKIVLLRHGEPVPLSLPEDSAFPLLPGETLQVAIRADRRYVVVQGAVAHPGLVEFAPGMTLSQAVGLAGGPLPDSDGNVILRSGIGKRQKSSHWSLAFIRSIRTPDPVLQPDDVLEVGQKAGGKG